MSVASPDRPSVLGFFCASTSWGGLEMNVLRLASWMHQRGHPVVFYGHCRSRLYREAAAAGLPVHHVRSAFKYGDGVNALKLARCARRDGVAHLIINFSKDLPFAVLAKTLAKNRFRLIMLQHLHVGGNKKDAFHTWQYRRLDAWIAPLPMFKEHLTANTRLDPDRIHVVPFGIEMDRFLRDLPAKSEARQALKLPPDVPIAGIVGRLDVKKGQDVLIRACAEVHRGGLPLHLLVVGEGTFNESEAYPRQLRQLTAELGLDDYVHFRPFQDRVEQAYAAMDLFVLASHSETYGMVTIEAMASGLPVVATATGGTREIIEHERTGLLAPPGDVSRLCEALLRLMRDEPLRASLADAARHEAVQRYSHETQCRTVEMLLAGL